MVLSVLNNILHLFLLRENGFAADCCVYSVSAGKTTRLVYMLIQLFIYPIYQIRLASVNTLSAINRSTEILIIPPQHATNVHEHVNIITNECMNAKVILQRIRILSCGTLIWILILLHGKYECCSRCIKSRLGR